MNPRRDFDFWIGRWDVTRDDGTAAGTNVITSEAAGAVLIERWESVAGHTGVSLNFFDEESKVWRQRWVDHTGSCLDQAGVRTGNAMTLRGVETGPQKTTLHETTWTLNGDGTVRQIWRASSDGAESWTIVFNGLYRQRAE